MEKMRISTFKKIEKNQGKKNCMETGSRFLINIFFYFFELPYSSIYFSHPFFFPFAVWNKKNLKKYMLKFNPYCHAQLFLKFLLIFFPKSYKG
jgi:hypothetical protein